MNKEELITFLYQEVIESNSTPDQLLMAWDKCEETYGEIQVGDPIDNLFYQTICYVIETLYKDKP